MKYDIKIWLRLLEDGTYRMVTNPDMVEPDDIEAILPFSKED